jgi:hypothetical protein
MKKYHWEALAMIERGGNFARCIGSAYLCADELHRGRLELYFRCLFAEYTERGEAMRQQDEAQTRLLMGEVGR